MSERLIPLTLEAIIAYHETYAGDLTRYIEGGALTPDLEAKAIEDRLMARRIAHTLRPLLGQASVAERLSNIATQAREAFYKLPPPVKPDEGEAYVTLETALEALEAGVSQFAMPIGPDGCEACHGARGGAPGNENIVDGRKLCDWCSHDAMRKARGETEEHKTLYNRREGCTGVIVGASGGGVTCTECPGWFCF